MVTMQKRGEPSVQTFSLPLSPIIIPNDKDPGKTQVQVDYKF